MPKLNNSLPGPGYYSPQHNLTKEKFASWRVGSSNRGDLSLSSNAPGPGQYDSPKKMGNGPKWR